MCSYEVQDGKKGTSPILTSLPSWPIMLKQTINVAIFVACCKTELISLGCRRRVCSRTREKCMYFVCQSKHTGMLMWIRVLTSYLSHALRVTFSFSNFLFSIVERKDSNDHVYHKLYYE